MVGRGWAAAAAAAALEALNGRRGAAF